MSIKDFLNPSYKGRTSLDAYKKAMFVWSIVYLASAICVNFSMDRRIAPRLFLALLLIIIFSKIIFIIPLSVRRARDSGGIKGFLIPPGYNSPMLASYGIVHT